MKKNSIKHYYKQHQRFPSSQWHVDSYDYKDDSPHWSNPETKCVQVENQPFWATVSFKSTFRGRSAARLKVLAKYQDGSECVFDMFLTHALEVLQTCKVENGECSGWWWVVAKGANCGLRSLGQGEEPV